MLDFAGLIAKEFSKTIVKTVQRYAKEKGVPEEQIQVLLSIDEREENVYRICHNYQPYLTVEFVGGIIKGHFDFTGKGKFIPPVLNDILKEVAIENGLPVTTTSIMIIRKDTDNLPVCFYLYNGTQPVKPLTAEELFSKIKTE